MIQAYIPSTYLGYFPNYSSHVSRLSIDSGVYFLSLWIRAGLWLLGPTECGKRGPLLIAGLGLRNLAVSSLLSMAMSHCIKKTQYAVGEKAATKAAAMWVRYIQPQSRRPSQHHVEQRPACPTQCCPRGSIPLTRIWVLLFSTTKFRGSL